MDTSTKAARPQLETFPYDITVFLRSAEECAGYLDVWLEESPEDSRGISNAIGDIARAHGLSQVADATQLSEESLLKTLSERRNPSFATVMKVLTAMGIRLRAELVGTQGEDASKDG